MERPLWVGRPRPPHRRPSPGPSLRGLPATGSLRSNPEIERPHAQPAPGRPGTAAPTGTTRGAVEGGGWSGHCGAGAPARRTGGPRPARHCEGFPQRAPYEAIPRLKDRMLGPLTGGQGRPPLRARHGGRWRVEGGAATVARAPPPRRTGCPRPARHCEGSPQRAPYESILRLKDRMLGPLTGGQGRPPLRARHGGGGGWRVERPLWRWRPRPPHRRPSPGPPRPFGPCSDDRGDGGPSSAVGRPLFPPTVAIRAFRDPPLPRGG